jgi:hypothetical protein
LSLLLTATSFFLPSCLLVSFSSMFVSCSNQKQRPYKHIAICMHVNINSLVSYVDRQLCRGTTAPNSSESAPYVPVVTVNVQDNSDKL